MSSSVRLILLLFLGGLSMVVHGQGEFRQRTEHYLAVELDDVRHVVFGTDSLVYQNQSGDTLRTLLFHLFPNAFQPGSYLSEHQLRQGNPEIHFTPKEKQGELSGLVFRVGGRAMRWEFDPLDNTLCSVELPAPLLPDSVILIHIMFRLSVPSIASESPGHNGQSYFLSRWFPQPVMYDASGWNPGAGRGESGDINLSVSVPKNYMVGSSGTLSEDAEEEKWLANLDEKTRKINRWGRKEQAKFPTSAQKMKTLNYTLPDADDIALCFDKRFYYLYDTVHFAESGRTIGVHMYFTMHEAAFWSGALASVRKVLQFMSSALGDYPFSQLTVVQTTWSEGGGCYPAMVRIGSALSKDMLESEIARQVAAHWSSVALITDSQEDPWFHYGLAGYYAERFLRDEHHDTLTIQDMWLDPYLKVNVAGMNSHPVTWIEHFRFAFLQEDERQIALLPADRYTRKSFITAGQIKSAKAFRILAEVLGVEAFDAMMSRYYRENQGKKITYADFRSYLEQSCGAEVTGWFFEQLLLNAENPDYAITSCKKTVEGYRITVKNRGKSAVPYPLTITGKGGSKVQWLAGHTAPSTFILPDVSHGIKRVSIDAQYTLPELKKHNNTIRTKGIFRRIEPVKVIPVAALPDMRYSELNLSPVIGWNSTNGFMAGIASYSNPIIRPDAEYLLMPLYGTLDRKLAGSARFEYHFRPSSGWFSRIDAGVEAKRYGWDNSNLMLSYQRLVPYLTFQVRRGDPWVTSRHRVTFRSVMIAKEVARLVDSLSGEYQAGTYDQFYVNEIAWRYRNGKVVSPFRSQVTVQQSSGMVRLMAEGNWFIHYGTLRKGFSIRAFSGLVLAPASEGQLFDYRFTTAGVASNTKTVFRPYDPLFDYLYLGRSNANGLLRNHFYMSDGGFKRATTVGNTQRWMITLNLSTTLPGKMPGELWLDAGLFADDAQEDFFGGMMLFSSGVKFTLFRDVAEVYFPFTFFESKEIAEREKLNNLSPGYLTKIRFVFNLHQLNPLTLPGKIRL